MLRSLLISFALVTPAAAQVLPVAKVPSLAELGPVIDSLQTIPTFTEVETMKRTLDEAIAAKDCKQIIAQGEPFAAEAAVLIAVAGEALAPVRGGPMSASDMLPSTAMSRDVGKQLQSFAVGRAEAFVATADCFAASGKQAMAIRFYNKTLNAISADETALWERAATGLWTQLGAKPQP